MPAALATPDRPRRRTAPAGPVHSIRHTSKDVSRLSKNVQNATRAAAAPPDTSAFRHRNRGLLVKFARRSLRGAYGMELEDLLAIGEMALHRASLTYRPEHGAEGTWAGACIQRAMFNAVRSSREIPAKAQDIMRQAARIFGENWRDRPAGIAVATLDISAEEWERAVMASRYGDPLSLESLSEGENGTTFDLAALADPTDVEDLAIRNIAAAALRDAVRSLPPDTGKVIELTYLAEPPCTLREAAAVMGYSFEWARRHQKRGIEALRACLNPEDMSPLMAA